MKKVKFFTMLAAAVLMTGITSCSNDDVPEGGKKVDDGEATAMGLIIKTPHAPQTYASSDDNATDFEIKLNTADVLIYGETATGSNIYLLEKNAHLISDDFEPVTGKPDTYKLKNGHQIKTTTGNKRIYVAMNYPGTLPAINDNLTELADLVHSLEHATQLSENGISMFNTEVKEVSLIAETIPNETPGNNQVSVNVKRLVAKVTVQENIERDNQGDIISQKGWLSNLQFAIGNSNKTIYPLQKRVSFASNVVVHDYNWVFPTGEVIWAEYRNANFFNIDYDPDSKDYQSIDLAATEVLALKVAYAPENTAEKHHPDGYNLTYISVRAKYVPEFFCNEDGVSKGDNTRETSPKSFWTVTKPGDVTIMYFNNIDEAGSYADKNEGKISLEYVEGFCYFRAYLNKKGVADEGLVAAKYDVLRNNYYKATVNSIKAPGLPIDEGKITEDTSLIVNVEVEPWVVVSDDYDLQ